LAIAPRRADRPSPHEGPDRHDPHTYLDGIPRIRVATPEDAAQITAIYGPIVRRTTISFELEPPTVDEMRGRIAKTLPRFPWLVSLNHVGVVDGYVYASVFRDRPAYQSSVEVTAYVREDVRR
jgi:phosphinothricin acetyltransferase